VRTGKISKWSGTTSLCLVILFLFSSGMPAHSAAETINYTYDDTYRLTQVSSDNGYAESYAYDVMGNRSRMTVIYSAEMSVSPASLDFGDINVGSASSALTITITNTWTNNLHINAITLTGADSNQFSISNDNCSNHTVAPSDTCTLHVVFSPTSGGPKDASLSIPSNAPSSPLSLLLSGAGQQHIIATYVPAGFGTVSCSPNPVDHGATSSCTVTAATGYHANTVSGCSGTWTGSSPYVTGVVTENCTVIASFSINTYSITTSPGANGGITCSPNPVNYDTSSTCTISPNTGYHIASVTVDSVPQSATSPYIFNNVTTTHTIEATFAINGFTVSASAPGGYGTISCASPVNYGGNSVCIITPDTGYHLQSLTDNGAPVPGYLVMSGGDLTYTFTNITADHTNIVAVFEEGDYVVDLRQTGQTTSYASGDDGALQEGVAWPNPRFTVNTGAPDNGGSLTDNLTGLVWTKAAGTPTVGSCAGGTKTWQESLDYVACLNTNNYLGHNDWRLSNKNELKSLINAGQANLATWLNSNGFTSVQTSYYWSSSTPASSTSSAWYVYMANHINYYGKTAKRYVWPVRTGGVSGSLAIAKTGQTTSYAAGDDGAIASGACWPSPRFTDNSDGTVTDNLTGLIWLKNANCFGAHPWTNGLSSAASLANGQCGLTDGSSPGDWRLPNMVELHSLVNAGQSNTATWLNASGGFGNPFTSVQSNSYQTSTTYAPGVSSIWYISMNDGKALSSGKTSNLYIWPVKGGSWSLGDSDMSISPDEEQIEASSGAGNAEAVKSKTPGRDHQGPALSVSTLSDNAWTSNGTLNISGDVYDDGSGLQGLTINGIAVTVNPDNTFSHAMTLGEGVNIIAVLATDNAGNETIAKRTINYDAYAPVIVIDQPADNSKTNNQSLTVSGYVDKYSTVTRVMNNSAPLPFGFNEGNGTFSLNATLTFGTNTVEVDASNLAQNTSTAKRTIIFDNVAPSLAITEPPQDVTTSQASLDVKGAVSDVTIKTVTVQVDGSAPENLVVTAGQFAKTITFTSEKTFVIQVTAVDEAGNVSTVTRNVIYSVDHSRP
jgi:hypothetical protein